MKEVIANVIAEMPEVKEIEKSCRCPKCNIGYLGWTVLVLKGEVDKYMNKCDNIVCDYKKLSNEKYS